eukprot:m.28967 g.28967  ORF g.28967 m.28967 type:complete len:62 (+) comp6621_c0_seq1:5574-5759(+)
MKSGSRAQLLMVKLASFLKHLSTTLINHSWRRDNYASAISHTDTSLICDPQNLLTLCCTFQ